MLPEEKITITKKRHAFSILKDKKKFALKDAERYVNSYCYICYKQDKGNRKINQFNDRFWQIKTIGCTRPDDRI